MKLFAIWNLRFGRKLATQVHVFTKATLESRYFKKFKYILQAHWHLGVLSRKNCNVKYVPQIFHTQLSCTVVLHVFYTSRIF